MRQSLLLPLLLILGLSLQAQEEFRCSQSAFEVQESDGTVTLHVERTSNFATPATGRLRIFPHSDVDMPFAIELPFAPGVTSRSHDLPIDNEFYDGPNRIFVACDGFTTGPPPTNLGPTSFWLSIVDDEPVPAITAAPVVIDEDQGTIALELTITPPFADIESISVFSTDVTAVKDDDYERVGFVTDIGAREPTFRIPVTVIDDDEAEDDERFRIQFTPVLMERKDSFVDVKIVDDDRPPYVFALDKARYEVSEATPLSVTVTRVGGPAEAVSTVLRFSPADHSPWPADVPVAFGAAETSKTVVVPFADSWYTRDRTGTVSITVDGFATDNAAITVLEDDPLPVLTISGAEVREGAAGEITRADVRLTLDHPAGIDVRIGVATKDETATAADYTPVEKLVVLAPGTLTATVRVNVHNDEIVEPTETLTVAITACCDKAARVGTREAFVTILDDDEPDGGEPEPDTGTYRLEGPPSLEWRESQKWLSAKIVRADGNGPSTITAKLTLDAARQFLPAEVRFREGETRKSVRFYIDDSIYSGHATGNLEIFDGTVREDTRAVTVLEDEPRPVVSVSDTEIIEGTGRPDAGGAFVLTVDPPSFQPIALTALATPGPYELDFRMPDSQQVVIPSLATRFEVPFTVVGDTLAEPDEWFQFQFDLPAGSHADEGNSIAICTIHDDDEADGWLTLAGDRVERGGTVMATAIFREPQTGEGVITPSSPDGALGVPPLVEYRAGATRVDFPVQGLRRGPTVLRLSFGTIPYVEVPLFVYSVATPVVPPAVRVGRGGVVSVPLSLAPADEEAVTVTIVSSDPRIASVPPSVTLEPGAGGTFEVVGAAMGTAMLTITLPAELGGTSVQLPVEVGEPMPKRRAAR